MSEASASISRIPGEIRMALELLSVIALGVAGSFVIMLSWSFVDPGPWSLVLKQVDVWIFLTPSPSSCLYASFPTPWGVVVWSGGAVVIHERGRGRRLRSWLIAVGMALVVTLLRIRVAVA